MLSVELFLNLGYFIYLGIAMVVSLQLLKNETLRQLWGKPPTFSYTEFCLIAGFSWIVSWLIIYLWWRKR